MNITATPLTASAIGTTNTTGITMGVPMAKPVTKTPTKPGEENKVEKKETKSNTKPKKEEVKEFTGPRRVLVYGNELFTVEDPKVTLEQVRQQIVDEFGFAEFSKTATEMTFDKETGIIVPVRSFKSRG